MGDGGPRGGAFDRFLPVLGETAAASQPCECALDHPAAGQQHEALGGIAAVDDFEGPTPVFAQRLPEFVPCISAIGEQVPQPGEPITDRLDQIDRPVAVLDAGCVDRHEQHQPEGKPVRDPVHADAPRH